MPSVRRQPWGSVWATAPWDGRARQPDPVRMPATAAAPVPAAAAAVPLRRRAFGRLLQAAPWAGPPAAPGRHTFDLPPVPLPAADDSFALTADDTTLEPTA